MYILGVMAMAVKTLVASGISLFADVSIAGFLGMCHADDPIAIQH